MHKLGFLRGDAWVEHSFPPVLRRNTTSVGTTRITAGVPSGEDAVFSKLLCATEPPYQLLYVLHTPRGEGAPGRYQSPALQASQLRDFVFKYRDLLRYGSRFDLWGHSAPDQATVVWERHSILYAYGPLDLFESELRSLGYSDGDVDVSFPHEHYYRAELDHLAKGLLADFDWNVTPLRPEDHQ
jgi:hypothetical protein